MMSAAATHLEWSSSRILDLERSNDSLRERNAYLQNRIDDVRVLLIMSLRARFHANPLILPSRVVAQMDAWYAYHFPEHDGSDGLGEMTNRKRKSPPSD